MLQKTETTETHAPAVHIPATGEERTGQALPPQDLDTELAELTAWVDAAITRSKKQITTFQKTILRRYVIVAIPILIVMACCYFAILRGLVNPGIGMFIELATIGGMVISTVIPTILSSRRAFRHPTDQERLAAQRLAEIDDVRAIAPLIDYLHCSGRTPELWQALGQRLSHLTEEQARELGPERHGILAGWLKAWEDSLNAGHLAKIGNRPVLGILHAFAQLGQSSIQTIQPPFKINVSLLALSRRWANGRKLGRDPAIQQAAAACYEAIKSKIALSHSGEQLLRASAPTPSSPENLLRPAQDTQQTPPQELLRSTPANPPENGREESDAAKN